MPITSGIINTPASLRSELITFSPESVIIISGIRSDDQLDLQSLHRVRERWVMRGAAVINQMRGLLLEREITVRKGLRHQIVEAAGVRTS